MSWRCPACQTVLQHQHPEPHPGIIYRCPVCRLELVLDPETGKLMLVPLDVSK